MKIFHIYKADCFGSSRVMLQSGWNKEAVFVHRTCHKLPPRPFDSSQSIQLTFLNVLRLAFKNRDQENIVWFFHAQSSLPYLLFFNLFFITFSNRTPKIVYDVHDLNETNKYKSKSDYIRYGLIRHYILKFFEFITVYRSKYGSNIMIITVSEGLARIIAEDNLSTKPVVVRSIPKPQFTAAELRDMNRSENAIIYFGTKKRLPFSLIDEIGYAGYELHLYGRDITANYIEEQIGKQLPEHIKIFGEYNPANMDFLTDYHFHILYHPLNTTLNYRYSQPNKMFQALNYGLSVIASENFEELSSVLGDVEGAVQVLKKQKDIKSVLEKTKSLRQEDCYFQDSLNLYIKLYEQSKYNFLKLWC